MIADMTIAAEWLGTGNERMLRIERRVDDEITTFTLSPLEAGFVRGIIAREMPLPDLSFKDLSAAHEAGIADGWLEGYKLCFATVILGVFTLVLIQSFSHAAD